MGHHYIPRRFLRGFAGGSGLIWRFDKRTLQSGQISIPSAANESGMYPQELEDRLNEEYEQPFNAVLDRLDAGGQIAPEDVEAIAHYVLTLYRRVPQGRNLSREKAPEHLEVLKREWDAKLDQQLLDAPGEAEHIAQLRQVIYAQSAEILSGVDGHLWHKSITPETLPRLTAALKLMNWGVFHVPEGHSLFAGDNPVLYPEMQGIADPESEIALPLRSDIALVGTWKGIRSRTRLELTKDSVKLINRYQVETADRWVFFKDFEPWMDRFLRKHTHP